MVVHRLGAAQCPVLGDGALHRLGQLFEARDHGAIEIAEDKEAWRLRQIADAEEPDFLTNFHGDDREGGTRASWGASMH